MAAKNFLWHSSKTRVAQKPGAPARAVFSLEQRMTRISPNTTPGYLHFYLKEDGGESFCDLIRQFFDAAEKRQSCKKFYNFAVIGDVLIRKHFITVPIFGLWDIYNL